jgi:N-acetyl-D-muramate 6-phosphate phosphatase
VPRPDPALPLRAVLFDLDGTLLDTAPDMVGALNTLRRERGLAPLDYDVVRPGVSHGAVRLLKIGFPLAEGDDVAALQKRFLDIYRGALAVGTRLFAGMDRVLDALAERGLKSGIVTNKPSWLTDPLLEQMGIRARFDCVVSGDSVAQCKPHPLPLQHAAKLAGVLPGECIYVGDAERDVQAAHAAGMPALVANYGYLQAGEDTAAWRGDAYLDGPLDLLGWLDASGRA